MNNIDLHPSIHAAGAALAYCAIEAHKGDLHAATKELEQLRDSLPVHGDLLYGAHCIAIMMIPERQNDNRPRQ